MERGQEGIRGALQVEGGPNLSASLRLPQQSEDSSPQPLVERVLVHLHAPLPARRVPDCPQEIRVALDKAGQTVEKPRETRQRRPLLRLHSFPRPFVKVFDLLGEQRRAQHALVLETPVQCALSHPGRAPDLVHAHRVHSPTLEKPACCAKYLPPAARRVASLLRYYAAKGRNLQYRDHTLTTLSLLTSPFTPWPQVLEESH